jgi:hypothetical protein
MRSKRSGVVSGAATLVANDRGAAIAHANTSTAIENFTVRALIVAARSPDVGNLDITVAPLG